MAGQRIGYIRVSSLDQNTVRPLEGIELERIFTDKPPARTRSVRSLRSCCDSSRTGTPWPRTAWVGASAEFERALIGERQREGITLAKARGAYRGRKKALSPEPAGELRRRAGAGEQKAGLAREFGISRETLYQYLRAGS